MNVFGDERDFAILAALDPAIEPPSAVWGSLAVACRGSRLGDAEETGCALYPAYLAFRELVVRLDELWDSEFEARDAVTVAAMLRARLYGDGDHPDAFLERLGVPAVVRAQLEGAADLRAERDFTRFGKFEFLTSWGEPFDGYESFLCCPPGGDVRILSASLPHGYVEVTRTGLLEAVHGFLGWFEAAQQRLA